MLTNNVQVDIIIINICLYLVELVGINLISNTSLMMSGNPQILASGYLDSKFTIRFNPNLLYDCKFSWYVYFPLKSLIRNFADK